MAVSKVKEFLEGDISLEEFEDWSALLVSRPPDANAKKIAQTVRGLLNAFGENDSDKALREELAKAIRPFDDARSTWSNRPPGVIGKPVSEWVLEFGGSSERSRLKWSSPNPFQVELAMRA